MGESREFYKKATLKLLEEENRIIYHDNYNDERSAIGNGSLPWIKSDMKPGDRIVISQEVYQKMCAIGNTTNNEGLEVPFTLFGQICKNTLGKKTLYFQWLQADPATSGWQTEHFDKQQKAVQSFVDEVKRLGNGRYDGTYVIAQGHTHPRKGNYYLNFSLADMIGYMQWRKDNNVFNTNGIFLCSVLLTGGNYNFLFYDGNDYYKFKEVFVADGNNRWRQLPCYGQDVITMGRGGRGY